MSWNGKLVAAHSGTRLEQARVLLRDYALSLGVDLGFQDFEREVAELPGAYRPPRGALIVAAEPGGGAAGCVALRPVDELTGELKRLYVTPAHRGSGVGRLLAEAAIAAAREAGYGRIVLDTLPGMDAAQALYRSLGFAETAAYRFNPVPGASFLALEL